MEDSPGGAWARVMAVAIILASVMAWSYAIRFAIGRSEPFGPGDVLWGLSFLAVQAVGAIVVFRRPRDAAGWHFLWAPFAIAVGVLGSDYFGADFEGRASLPGPEWMLLAGNVSFGVGVGGLALALYRFPDGLSVGRFWRVAERVTVAGMIGTGVLSLFEPILERQVEVANPLTGGDPVPGIGALELVFNLSQPLLIGGLLSLVSLVARYRRGTVTTRLQLRWVLYPIVTGVAVMALFAAVDAVATIPVSTGTLFGVVVTVIFTLGVPFGILMAVTRHRLYDIDRLVSRTLSYAVVTAVLAAVYLAGVVGFQTLLRPVAVESDLAVAASTLGVAALFRPVRRRVQTAVDRRFDRSHYDGQQLSFGFAARLRDEVDLRQIDADLRATVRLAVQPSVVHVWLPGDALPTR